MAERCAFEGDCPMMDDLIDISGACTDNRGEKCGPVAAYGMLLGQMNSLTDADQSAPIEGSFKFNSVPAGDPPLEVREEWVGVEVPIRHQGRVKQGKVDVLSEDVILSLLSQGKLDAANWFTSLVYAMGEFTATFQAHEGEFERREPILSTDYYGSRLSEDARVAIEES